MKTYWHGDREVAIIGKTTYLRDGFHKPQIMLTLDMGGESVFYMWESDFLKQVLLRCE